MGKQRQKSESGSFTRALLSAFFPPTGAEPPVAGNAGSPFWNKLPRLINMACSKMRSDLGQSVLDYEPIHLHINPVELNAALEPSLEPEPGVQGAAPLPNDPAAAMPPGIPPLQRLAMESFRFLMDQVPAIRTIEFSGKEQDPLENPDLVKMVDYANKFNGAEITLITDGLLLGEFTEDLLKSRLHTLVIRLYAHRPSIYALMADKPANQFLTVLENTRHLLKRRKALNASLEVELCMTVDFHHYRQIPEMVQFAEDLGVDGLRLENYLSPDLAIKSDRTLYSHYENVQNYLSELEKKVLASSKVLVSMPLLLDWDMSSHRYCLDAYNTVSVDAEFNVSGCSRQLLLPEKAGKIWEEDFFNNSTYQWLRSIHGGQRAGCNAQVPFACQGCPRNMPPSG